MVQLVPYDEKVLSFAKWCLNYLEVSMEDLRFVVAVR